MRVGMTRGWVASIQMLEAIPTGGLTAKFRVTREITHPYSPRTNFEAGVLLTTGRESVNRRATRLLWEDLDDILERSR